MKIFNFLTPIPLGAILAGADHAASPHVPGATSGVQSMDVKVKAFTSSPLRNRLRVELKAPAEEVWKLVGNFARFPEYSSGLERVETTLGAGGAISGYVCHFKPQQAGAAGIAHREIIRWYEPNRGYASSGAQGNVFGLTNALNLVTLAPSRLGTILTWDEYYDAEDLEMNKSGYDQALADIGENLVRRFGGAILERHAER